LEQKQEDVIKKVKESEEIRRQEVEKYEQKVKTANEEREKLMKTVEECATKKG
jgi:hypothetical protein